MIDVLLLGTGGMMPLPDRWLSSVLLRVQGELLLFDVGEGTQISMHRFGWGFRRISAICLSHWHADHVAGLPGLLHTVANSGRSEPLTIYGPIETARVVHGLRVIAPVLPYPIEVVELAGSERFPLPGGATGSVLAGVHHVPSLMHRVDLPRAPKFDVDKAEALAIPRERWSELQRGETLRIGERTIEPGEVMGPPRRGASFGFMTDTRPVPEAPAFYHDVDLLVSEGTYGDLDQRDKAIRNTHMTFSEAAEIARRAEARALWLTHFSPSMADPESFARHASDIFPNVTIGRSGLTTSLRFRD